MAGRLCLLCVLAFSDLSELVDMIRSDPSSVLMCFKKHSAPHVLAVKDAWMDFFEAQGVQVTDVNELLSWYVELKREREREMPA